MKVFVQQKNWGHFFTLFWSKIWPFLLKNQFFGCFLENRLSEFHVTWSEIRDNCFQYHLTAVLCLGKFSFGRFGPFLVKNTLLVIIIFKALRLAAAVFMCFFIWPPPRDLSIARLLLFKLKLLFKNGQ